MIFEGANLWVWGLANPKPTPVLASGPHATDFGENAKQRSFRRLRSFKITDFCTNRKRVYDFLLVNNSNLHPVSHRFRDIAEYSPMFCCRQGASITHSFGVNP